MIRLKGNDERILSIELFDILKYISNINNYKWKILWFDGISKKNAINIPELEREINNSPNGLNINSTELIKFSKSLHQIIEIVLIGDKDETKLRRCNDEILKDECEFFLELVDSSYWEISSSNLSFLENIEKNLI